MNDKHGIPVHELHTMAGTLPVVVVYYLFGADVVVSRVELRDGTARDITHALDEVAIARIKREVRRAAL